MCGAASNTRAAATGASWLPTAAGQLHAGPGQGERQQRNHARPQQQQQQVPQLQPPLVRVVPLLDEPQRGKLQQRRPPPHDQVQHDRHRDQRGSGQK